MNQKGFSQLILVIIAGLVMVGGGTWYYKQSDATVEQAKEASKNAVPKTPAQTNAPTKQVAAPADAKPSAPTPNISCASPTDTRHMDIFDSHVHANPKVDMSQIISEMDKAGVSVANLYSGTPDIASKYPGRFITFVDTPDSPPSWLTQGQAFVTSVEAQLKTGGNYGVGETNLRYYSGKLIPPPTVYVPADTPTWLQLVDLSAKYHVPISFHFVPDDSTANAAFERMLSHNKDTILIWAHLGFNNMPLNSATLSDYLLRYPHLYFDTAGIQNMQQDPAPQANSNWSTEQGVEAVLRNVELPYLVRFRRGRGRKWPGEMAELRGQCSERCHA